MKKSINAWLVFLIISTLGLFAGCQQEQDKQGEQGEADPQGYLPAKFDPNAGQPISKDTAIARTKRYKASHNDPKKNTYANYCSKGIIDSILHQPGCAGLRIYRARNAKKVYGIVVVGVDAQGKDLINDKNTTTTSFIADSYEKCPLNCDGCLLIK